MTISEGTIIRIVASMLLPDSVIAQNVFYAVLTGGSGPWDEGDIVSDAIDYMDLIYSVWATFGSDQATVDEIQVYEYDPIDDDWDEVGSGVLGQVGGVAEDMLPHGVAGYTQARSSDPDVNASKYWAAATEAAQVDGAWIAGHVTGLGTLADAWVDGDVGAASGANLIAGVWSPTETNFFFFNGNITVNATPAYQRRRKPGVGT
jgi:hypothetical protein